MTKWAKIILEISILLLSVHTYVKALNSLIYLKNIYYIINKNSFCLL